MDAVTDRLLDARDGDRDAFADAIRLSERAVRRFVAGLVDPDDVDDTVQDTFLRAWKSLGRYRVEAAGQTWLLAIARHAAADVVDRRSRRRRLHRRYSATARARVDPDPAIAHALDDLVCLLEVGRREAFVLTQVVGASYDEAARVCGVPVGTIRSRVARARTDLMRGLHAADEVG